MTMMREEISPKKPKSSPSPHKSSSSSPSSCKYLKPGALAKLRDSKIANRRHRHAYISTLLSQHLSHSQLSPSSPSQNEQQRSPNHANGIPCFAPTLGFMSRPHCLSRKKLFAVTPVFTPTHDTTTFQ